MVTHTTPSMPTIETHERPTDLTTQTTTSMPIITTHERPTDLTTHTTTSMPTITTHERPTDLTTHTTTSIPTITTHERPTDLTTHTTTSIPTITTHERPTDLTTHTTTSMPTITTHERPTDLTTHTTTSMPTITTHERPTDLTTHTTTSITTHERPKETTYSTATPNVVETSSMDLIKTETCREEFDRGVVFPETPIGQTVTTPCPQNYEGDVNRSCLSDKNWGNFYLNNCLNKKLHLILKKIFSNATQATDVEDVAQLLAVFYQEETLLAGDLKNTLLALASLSKMNVTTSSFKDLLATFHQILEMSDDLWKDLVQEGSALFLALLKNIDILTTTMINFKQSDFYFNNLREFVTKIEKRKGTEVTNFNIELTQIEVRVEQPSSSEYLLGLTLFKNLNNLKRFFNDSLGSKIVALTGTAPIKSVKIYYNFEQQKEAVPECHYLDTHRWSSTWSKDGCVTKQINSSLVVCSCSHASIFAIIMSPFKEPETRYTTVLEKLTLAFLTASILSLFIAMVIFMILFRKLKKENAVINLSLCISLALGYIIFLTGIKRTEHEIVCKVIAVFLHLFFLISQFTMLANGIQLLRVLFFPLWRNQIWIFLLMVEIFPPLAIVIVTLATTNARGYGSKHICWLNTEGGTTFAFVGPVVIIWLINLVILGCALKKLLSLEVVQRLNAFGKIRTILWAIIVLSPILGSGYIMGLGNLIPGFTEAQYIFIVFSGGQGLLVLVVNCLLQKEIRSGLWQAYSLWKSRQLNIPATNTRTRGNSLPVINLGVYRKETAEIEQTKL